jgi:hypothetical protein
MPEKTTTKNDLNDMVASIISESLTNEDMRAIMKEAVTDGIRKIVRDTLAYHGPVYNDLKARLSDSMLKAVEYSDMADFSTKMQLVLDDVFKASAANETAEMLRRVGCLIKPENVPERTTVSDLFDEYTRWIECKIENEDDHIVTVMVSVNYHVGGLRGRFEYATVKFQTLDEYELPKDEYEKAIEISRFDNGEWSVQGPRDVTVDRLRRLDEFDLKAASLMMARTIVTIDKEEMKDDIENN